MKIKKIILFFMFLIIGNGLIVGALPNDLDNNIDFTYPEIINYSLIPTVNSSDYWDNLDDPSDINTGDITDDNTYIRADQSDTQEGILYNRGVIPTTDNGYNLGGFTSHWNNVYVSGFLIKQGTASISVAQAYSAYQHSIDNSQAHTDYLLNNLNDQTSGNLSTTKWFLGKINLTDDNSWIDFQDGNNITFNESMLSTIYYNGTSAEAVVGTIDGGTLEDTQHPDGAYDGVTFNFSEEAGSPALDLRVNFSRADLITFNNGIMRYKTSSLSGAYPIIQMWDYDSSTWEDYPYMAESSTFSTISQPIFDATDHVEDGVAQMRVYKASNGNTNNHYYVDWLAISKGYGTPAGEEVDPFSYHTNANINATGYNVTADNYFGDSYNSDIISVGSKNQFNMDMDIDTTATSFGDVYKGLYSDWNYIGNTGSVTNPVLTWQELDADFTNSGAGFFSPTLTILKANSNILNNRMIDIVASGEGLTNEGFAHISATQTGTATGVTALRTAGVINNPNSIRDAISYQGFVQQAGTGKAIPFNPYISGTGNASHWYFLQPTSIGTLIDKSLRFVVHTASKGHILIDRGGLAITSSVYDDLASNPADHISSWNSTDADGFLYVEEDMEVDGMAWLDGGFNISTDNVKSYFGANQEAELYFDGTDMVLNMTNDGALAIYNSSELGKVRALEYATSTANFDDYNPDSKFIDLLPSNILDMLDEDGKLTNIIPKLMGTAIVRDYNKCVEVPTGKTEWCYDTPDGEYCSLAKVNLTYFTNISHNDEFIIDYPYEDYTNEREIDITKTECGTKEITETYLGQQGLANTIMIAELNNKINELETEQNRIKTCLADARDFDAYKVCVGGLITP